MKLMIFLSLWICTAVPELDDFPTLEEAAAQLIHGKASFGRNGVATVVHDFQFVDHNRDFSGGVKTFLPGNRVPVIGEVDGQQHVSGAMAGFAMGAQVGCNIPMGRIDHIQMAITGIKQFAVTLEGGGSPGSPGDVAEIQLGAITKFRSQRGKKPRRWQNRRGVDLALADHRVDIAWKKGTLSISLDGRRVFRQKFGKKASPYQEVRFSAISGGDPALKAFMIQGALSGRLPLLVANQGRMIKSEPPLWGEQVEANSPRVSFVSPLPQEVVDQWCKGASDALDRYRGILGVPESFRHDVTVYLFEHKEVLRVYSGLGNGRSLGPKKIAGLYDPGREDAFGELVGLVVQSSVSGLSKALPEWWELGARGYHRELRLKDGELSFAPVPEDVKEEARAGLVALGEGGFARYLRERLPCKQTRSLSRAWVHFLIEAEDGARRDRVRNFLRALARGKSSDQAADAVFTEDVMKDLGPAFERFLNQSEAHRTES